MMHFQENRKYRLIIFFAIITTLVSCSKRSVLLENFNGDKIIHHSQMALKEDLSGYVIFFDKGDILPLKISLESGLFGVEEEVLNLVCQQRVYFRLIIPPGMSEKKIAAMSDEEKQELFRAFMIYISPDAKRWAPYTDIKTVEQLFGIKGGSLSLGMGITQEDGLSILLNLKVNNR